MIRSRIVILLTFISVSAGAQNLVPNPSFEEVARCPVGLTTEKKDFIIPGWDSPTLGTPDHFHSCGMGDADVPHNWAGTASGHSGKAYAGIYVWSNEPERNYREYLQCELAEPLQTGVQYVLEFYYKLASNSVYAINRFGLTLAESPVNLSHDKMINLIPIISVERDSSAIITAGKWERAKQIYEAKGGERYLIIGNFFDNRNTRAKRLPYKIGMNVMLTNNSYYLIDDISVRPVDSLKQKVMPRGTKFKSNSIELNTDYILEDIQFEIEGYLLQRSSFVELDKIVEYLKQRPDLNVRLTGHTDFNGTDDYNLGLSRNRARSVADHFIQKGIQSERIISYGFGKSHPITLEKTEEARKINRRVEIRFVTE